MNVLKRIPIHYKGELHDVRLINLTVEVDEIKGEVPAHIKPRDFNGRAMISMVDVKLKNMRPSIMPLLKFNYRHIAFRLLVDDAAYTSGDNKGIFFFKSFTDKPLIVVGGKLLTDYNLERARVEDENGTVRLTQGSHQVKYCVNERNSDVNHELKKTIGALDRAYSVLGDTIRVTQIQREKWPIEAVGCSGFENTFFTTAKFEGAFRVFETIYYDWLPPKVLRR
jgi:uncharacterized protein YqjF (DUF2071 family)